MLLLECTFLDDKKGIEIARKGCHIHLEELMEWASLFKNQHIVLMHFSQIHSLSEIQQLCKNKLGSLLHDRLHLLLPPSQSSSKPGWWL